MMFLFWLKFLPQNYKVRVLLTPCVTTILQVRLQRPSTDWLLRSPSAVRRLPDVCRWRPCHAAVLRLPASCHHPPPAEPRLVLLRPASLGPAPAPVSPTHSPTHPGPHDKVTDRRGCGRDVSPCLPGEVGAPHLQARGPADKDRHAQEALPSLGRPLRRQAPAEDYKHPAVHNAGRCGYPLPWRTPAVWTLTVWVLTLTQTCPHT